MRFRGFIKHALHTFVPGRKGWFTYFGTRVYFPQGSLIFALACDQGVYEKDLVDMMLMAVKPGTTVFDVGANIGLMALPLLSSIPDCEVCSFEPSPNTLPYLQRTQAESPWAKRWKLISKAVGDQPGTATFNIAATAMGALDGFQNTHRAGSMSQVEVEVTTLDDVWRSLGSPPVSLMKMDIEGAETLALAGAKALLQEARPTIFLEWNRENLAAYKVPVEHLLALAAEFRYEVRSVPGLVKVEGDKQLRLHTSETETFVLLPQ